MNSVKRWLTILMACLFAAACAPAPPENTIIISGPFEPVNQDTATAGYIFTRMQIIETLVDVDDEGNLTPGLAINWHPDETFTQWHFELRPDVYFHDGQPMTAQSVVNSLRVAMGKPAPFNTRLIKHAEALSEREVLFTLTEPFRPFPSLLSNYTTAILSPATFGTFNRIKSLIGTGPYQIEDFEPPHNIKARRFDNYWGKPATIEKAEYITGHRSETRALMVRTGQADIVYNLDPSAVSSLSTNPDVKVFSTPIPRTTQIKLNLALPSLSDPKVRQALSLALDRTGIAEGILRVPGAEANQLFGPTMGVWHLATAPTPTQQLDRARQLLDDAGWHEGDDGIRYRNHQPLELEMITYANRPELIVIATAIQDQWAQIGVNLNVEMENASAIPSGHHDGTLQTALMARNYANIPDPLGIMLADFTSEQGGDWGPMNWSNPDVFSGLNELAEETDDAAYQRTVTQVMTAIQNDLPLIPVVFYVQQSAVSARVKGFSFDPYERSFRISTMQLEQ